MDAFVPRQFPSWDQQLPPVRAHLPDQFPASRVPDTPDSMRYSASSSSRASSISASSPRQHRRGGGKARRASTGKSRKEKDARDLERKYRTDIHDIIVLYSDWNPDNLQTRGNDFSAGHTSTKPDLFKKARDILLYHLDTEAKHALVNGKIREFTNHYGSLRTEDPLLVLDVDRCEPSKVRSDHTCTTHGEPDWRECHARRSERAFDARVRHFCATQGVRAPEEYLGQRQGMGIKVREEKKR